MKSLTLLIILVTFPVFSAEPVWKQKIRHASTKIFGQEKTDQWLGKIVVKDLPPIPKLKDQVRCADCSVRDKKGILKVPKEKMAIYNRAFVQELVRVVRAGRSSAQNEDLGVWLNALEQGGAREGVYRALVLDQNYRGLESFDHDISPKAREFAVYFAGRYTGIGLSEDGVKKSNFFTIKRALTEKALEVIDTYINSNPENLYLWYSVFSKDFAQDYPQVWKNDMRKMDEYEIHEAWARSVPDQHIKSEVIIKIHKVFNFLNG